VRERLVEEQETTEEQRRDQSDRLEGQMDDLEAELDECREREQNLEVLYLMRTKIKCFY
jgi:phage shock protein A